MKTENKNCQNCKTQFAIEPEDFAFYEKIKVPPPTFCLQCRLQRRLSVTNLFNLYKRKCDLCGLEKISIFAPGAPYRVYCPECWWSDKWDFSEYGRDYDFSRPFFEQFDELMREAPLLGLSLDSNSIPTSPYNSNCGWLKDSYLLFFSNYSESCAYGFYGVHNKNVLDCSLLVKSELCYDVRNGYMESRSIGLRNTNQNLECLFLRDSKNCQNCFASANLRSRKYVIFNEQYEPEEYKSKLQGWDLGSYRQYQEIKKLAAEHWQKYPPRPIWMDFSVDSTGNYVFQSKNCKECYETAGAQDSKYLLAISEGPVKDCYDIFGWGDNLEFSYEGAIVGENAARLRFCQESGINAFDAEYCKLTTGGSHHFGCVAVKGGNYVIFNKRYSPEEFEALRGRIIAHMGEMPYRDRRGRIYKYGEFPPIELSVAAYNESLAQRFFPLTREQAEQEGYRWTDLPKGEGKKTISAAELPDNIKDAKEDVLKEVIGCAKCDRVFRIVSMELTFLRRMSLPLPRECPLCRIDEKFTEWVKQMKLVSRTCSKCASEFQTPYGPEDWPKILCHPCFKAEYGN